MITENLSGKGKAFKYKNKHDFLDIILENCYIHEPSGELYCKKCRNLVKIDWNRNLAYCSVHIISQAGIIYIEELYNIY